MNIKIFPDKTNLYPLYIFFYWLVIWAVYMLYAIFIINSSLTPDGKYVEKTRCLSQNKEEECVKYSKPYYTPLDQEIRNTFTTSGILIGFGTIGVGTILLYKNRKRTS